MTNNREGGKCPVCLGTKKNLWDEPCSCKAEPKREGGLGNDKLCAYIKQKVRGLIVPMIVLDGKAHPQTVYGEGYRQAISDVINLIEKS